MICILACLRSYSSIHCVGGNALMGGDKRVCLLHDVCKAAGPGDGRLLFYTDPNRPKLPIVFDEGKVEASFGACAYACGVLIVPCAGF